MKDATELEDTIENQMPDHSAASMMSGESAFLKRRAERVAAAANMRMAPLVRYGQPNSTEGASCFLCDSVRI